MKKMFKLFAISQFDALVYFSESESKHGTVIYVAFFLFISYRSLYFCLESSKHELNLYR